MNLVTVLGTGGTQSLLSIVVVYAVVLGVFWFFAIRPQKKQQKEHTALITTLEVGDSILTTSGFFGVVIDIMEEVVIVEFGNNKNSRLPMKKDKLVEIDKQSSEK